MRPLLAAFGLLLLASCSSSHKHAQPATNPLPSVAMSLGCKFVEDKPADFELFVADQGTCGPLTLYFFSSKEAMNNWITAAKQGGYPGVHDKQGPNWVAAQY